MSVKETGDMVEFVVALMKATSDVAHSDGYVAKAAAVMTAMQEAPDAFVGMGNIPAELANLNDAEKAVLFSKITALDLPNDTVEVWAERILKTAIVIGSLASDYTKALKA